MQLAINGIFVSIPDAQLERLVLDRLQGTELLAASVSSSLTPPPIGEVWPGQGGIYAGVVAGSVVGKDRDYHLIVGPEHEPMTFHDAEKLPATEVVDGHRDFVPPLRKEMRLEYCNVAGHFQQTSYWSGEQHPDSSACAYGQDFANGSQSYWRKDSKLRVRLVRRLTI